MSKWIKPQIINPHAYRQPAKCSIPLKYPENMIYMIKQ